MASAVVMRRMAEVGPGCPGLDSRRKHRKDVAVGQCLSDCKLTQQGGAAISSQPELWCGGIIFIKGNPSKERINSFMFDFDLRLGSPCCLHQSCSHPPGTVEGEASYISSQLGLASLVDGV